MDPSEDYHLSFKNKLMGNQLRNLKNIFKNEF